MQEDLGRTDRVSPTCQHVDNLLVRSEADLRIVRETSVRRGRHKTNRFLGAALVAVALLLAACGEEPATPGPGGPLAGRYVGQEIWLTYFSPEHALYGRRIHRTAEEARALAEALRARVLAGEDIGALAETHSNAPGAAAGGFSGVLPADADAPTERDRALASVAVGEVTPIVDWLGGMWFARRIDRAAAARLQVRLDRVRAERVRLRAIVLLYQGVWVPDPALSRGVTRTKERAVALAETLLERARAGEDFEALAREFSDDAASAKNGGLVQVAREGGVQTAWLHRFETWVPDSVLRAAFATPAGEVHPDVVVSPRGVFVLRVDARRDGQ